MSARLRTRVDDPRAHPLRERTHRVLRVQNLCLDARKSLTCPQIREVSRWRSRDEPLALPVIRAEVTRFAKRTRALKNELTQNLTQLTELIRVSEAAPLLDEMSFGPVSLVICLTAWSHAGCIRAEAAFASMASAKPISASSGQAIRYRLARGGDRCLNHPLHMPRLVE